MTVKLGARSPIQQEHMGGEYPQLDLDLDSTVLNEWFPKGLMQEKYFGSG